MYFCRIEKTIRMIAPILAMVAIVACTPVIHDLPTRLGSTTTSQVPPVLLDFFSKPGPYFSSQSIEEVRNLESLSNGTHPSLYIPKKGYIASKVNAWVRYLPFSLVILDETERVYLIQASHTFDDSYSILSRFHTRFYVIRKSDGKITRFHEEPLPGVIRSKFLNNVLYIMHDKDFPQVKMLRYDD